MAEPKNKINDSDLGWLKESFLAVSTTAISSARRDVYSDKRTKFTSTEPGGMVYMNPLPQACRYADIRVPNRNSRRGLGSNPISSDIFYDPDIRGLGNVYSSVFDDNAQVVHFRWGVPAFNSLSHFWTNFYNRDLSALARNGRVDDDLFSFIGSSIGTVFSIPFIPFILVGNIWRFFTNSPASKYWYVKPAMTLMWNSFQSLLNMHLVNKGLIPRTLLDEQEGIIDQVLGSSSVNRNDYSAMMRILHDFMPDVFDENGGIDGYRLANRATRINHQQNEALRAIYESSGSSEEIENKVVEYVNGVAPDPNVGARSMDEAMTAYMNSSLGNSDPSNKSDVISESVKRTFLERVGDAFEPVKDFIEDFGDLLNAELADGSAFISYRVNHTGTITESFSNSTAKPEIFNTINERSRDARNKIFDFAGGNLGDGIILGTAEAAISAAGNVVGGVLESVGLQGLAVGAGAAFVGTQELWEESLARIPEQNYTVELRAISADPLDTLLNIYLPLFGLMAPALPRSTGNSSYTGPMVGEMFDRGRCISRNLMIIEMTIERGVGDVGWSAAGDPLSIRVNFTAKDLNTILSMPIHTQWSLDPTKMILADDNPWNDYMAVLGNLSMRDVVYPLSGKLALNMARYRAGFRSWFSLSHIVNSGVNNTRLGQFWQGIRREFDRN